MEGRFKVRPETPKSHNNGMVGRQVMVKECSIMGLALGGVSCYVVPKFKVMKSENYPHRAEMVLRNFLRLSFV